ncbi:hypothetical protein A2U01_0047924, partial [Trifolium medium]|nr:hypothetical protein [Trifolium medium]
LSDCSARVPIYPVAGAVAARPDGGATLPEYPNLGDLICGVFVLMVCGDLVALMALAEIWV